jgi:hypothetical protein
MADENGLLAYSNDGVHPNKAGYEVMAPLRESNRVYPRKTIVQNTKQNPITLGWVFCLNSSIISKQNSILESAYTRCVCFSGFA